MGMIECWMKKVPDGVDTVKFLNTVVRNIRGSEEEKEGFEVRRLQPEDFEWAWDSQDNLKKEEPIKEKYRELTKKDRVIFVEIDW